MNSAKPKEIFIPLNTDFDWATVAVGEPKVHSFKKGESTVQWVTSDVWVLGENGEHRPVYVELQKQSLWGISGFWPLNIEEAEKTMERISGLQLHYPMTSPNTVDEPTKEETWTREVFDKMRKITVSAMERFCSVPRDKRKVPAPTFNAYVAAERDKNWLYAVKPIYDYVYSEDKTTGIKIPDLTKPMKSCIKFSTKGKGSKIFSDTKVFGPGDKQINPLEYLPTCKGEGHPVVYWDGIFWGSHGQKAPYGASVRLRVSEMNFTPTKNSSFSSRRFLAPNNAEE